jgi:plastocyanin
MRYRNFLAAGLLLLVACSGYSMGPGYGGGGGGGGGQGGGGGGPVGAVTVGPGIQFVSAHDGSQNPAVTQVAVGATVTWTWSGSLRHSVQSTGTTSFVSSAIMSSGSYALQFNTPGTYHYICAVHGASMSGTVIVQ